MGIIKQIKVQPVYYRRPSLHEIESLIRGIDWREDNEAKNTVFFTSAKGESMIDLNFYLLLIKLPFKHTITTFNRIKKAHAYISLDYKHGLYKIYAYKEGTNIVWRVLKGTITICETPNLQRLRQTLKVIPL